MKRHTYSFALLMAMVVGALLPFSPAHALTISPARIELESDPGTTIGGDFVLINEQDEQKTFYASYENFDAQGETGTPNFTKGDTGLASWISTAQSQVTLKPKESKKIPFTIKIPAEAEPGGYFSAIFWSTTPPEGDSGQVAIGAKIGMLVLLRVSGQITEAGGVSEFKTADGSFFYNTLPVDMYYRFRNDGGDRVRPTGTVTIKNTLFLKTAALNANPVEGNILPKSTRKFDLSWVTAPDPSGKVPTGFFAKAKYQWQNFAVGFYTAHLELAYGTAQTTAAKSLTVFVFPWQLLLLMVLTLFVLWVCIKKGLKRYNNFIIAKARAVQKE